MGLTQALRDLTPTRILLFGYGSPEEAYPRVSSTRHPDLTHAWGQRHLSRTPLRTEEDKMRRALTLYELAAGAPLEARGDEAYALSRLSIIERIAADTPTIAARAESRPAPGYFADLVDDEGRICYGTPTSVSRNPSLLEGRTAYLKNPSACPEQRRFLPHATEHLLQNHEGAEVVIDQLHNADYMLVHLPSHGIAAIPTCALEYREPVQQADAFRDLGQRLEEHANRIFAYANNSNRD